MYFDRERWFGKTLGTAFKGRPKRRPKPAPSEPPPKLLTRRYLILYPIVGIVLSSLLIYLCMWMDVDRHPFVALILFPLPMAAAINIGGEEMAFYILSSLQFPLYGLLLGYGHGIDGLPSFSAALGVAHVLCIGFAFISFL